MADLKVYRVKIGGLEHHMQFTEGEARRRGLTEVKAKEAEKPENKSRQPRNKSTK